MLAGEDYDAADPELVADRDACERLVRAFNDAPDGRRRVRVLCQLLGFLGEGAEIRPPFICDYGFNVSMGHGAFVNYGAVMLDCAPVSIGERAQIGPGVQLLTADHPRDPGRRRAGLESARPVTIGANAWLGGGVIVCPGVVIGDDSVIGAGSVVTGDVPAGVVAAGSPCRVQRRL